MHVEWYGFFDYSSITQSICWFSLWLPPGRYHAHRPDLQRPVEVPIRRTDFIKRAYRDVQKEFDACTADARVRHATTATALQASEFTVAHAASLALPSAQATALNNASSEAREHSVNNVTMESNQFVSVGGPWPAVGVDATTAWLVQQQRALLDTAAGSLFD